jgi:hypothetical protein
MHPYATNSGERKMVIVYIIAASILLAYALHRGVISGYIPIPWWIETPSVLGFFGLLYAWFDRSLWRSPMFHALGIVKVPDLNGNWTGEVKSTYDGETSRTANVKIDQTWTEICIELQTDHSRSDSMVAAILFPKPGEIVLTYQYRSEPHAHARDTMHVHRGTAWLCFWREEGIDYLEGEYYSGRDRRNIGTMSLKRATEAKFRAAVGAK